MASRWDKEDEREKRKAILKKAEFEINLAEREVQEWKMHKRESPRCPEIINKTHTLSDILAYTPHSYSPIPSPDLMNLERRIRDLEEIRKEEKEKHRIEVERLEKLIDKMQQSRRSEQKQENLQGKYEAKSRELLEKNKEIAELRGKAQKELKKPKTPAVRSSSHASFESSKPKRPPKPTSSSATHWKTKAYELSTKYFITLKSMRQELSKIRSDCTSEWKTFRETFQNALKKIQILK